MILYDSQSAADSRWMWVVSNHVTGIQGWNKTFWKPQNHHINLLDGFNSSETYESQLGLLFPVGKNKFQTTNQRLWKAQSHVLP